MTNNELLKVLQEKIKNDFYAKQILLHALETDNTKFILIRSSQAKQSVVDKALKMADELVCGRPLYYILGECEFYSYPFYVGEGVLIPRDDTEVLVDTALKTIENIKNPNVLDLCSGSGAIAIAIAKSRTDATVTAVELYDSAYNYLLKNIKLNNADNVTALKKDALEFAGDYDLVVSNPPYISEDERGDLSNEVLKEPENALFADEDGLLFYKKIAHNFKNYKNFTLIFEIGYRQKGKVTEILQKNGYENIETIKDFGGNDRVIKSVK